MIDFNKVNLSPEELRMKRSHEEIWQHVKTAKEALPSPIREIKREASLAKLENAFRIRNVAIAIDALECLADINECSSSFHEALNAANQKFDSEPLFQRVRISPLVDHPKNRHITHKPALPFLLENDKSVIEECLRVVGYADIFPEWEYSALFGFGREDFVALVEQWPNVDDADKKNARMINNGMNHLLGYPHGKMDEWSNHISVPPEEVLRVLQKWRQLKGWQSNDAEPSYFGSFV